LFCFALFYLHYFLTLLARSIQQVVSLVVNEHVVSQTTTKSEVALLVCVFATSTYTQHIRAGNRIFETFEIARSRNISLAYT